MGAEGKRILGFLDCLNDRPVKTFYSIAGRHLLIEAQDDWCARAASSVFDGWFLKPYPANGSEFPAATLRLKFATLSPSIPHGLPAFPLPGGGVCYTDGQTFHFDFDGSLVVSGPGTAPNVDIWITKRYELSSPQLGQIISQALGAALRRCDLYELHSAAVVPPGYDKAVLIAGPSGSGKTTLATQLVAYGWNYISDDKLLLQSDKQGPEVYAVRTCFALRAHTISALQLSHLIPAPASPSIKGRVSPQDLFPARQIERARPGWIVFPVLTQKVRSDMRRLTVSETMTELLRLCPWAAYDKPIAAKHLAVLANLARECVGFQLQAGTDLLEDRRLVADFCVRCMST